MAAEIRGGRAGKISGAGCGRGAIPIATAAASAMEPIGRSDRPMDPDRSGRLATQTRTRNGGLPFPAPPVPACWSGELLVLVCCPVSPRTVVIGKSSQTGPDFFLSPRFSGPRPGNIAGFREMGNSNLAAASPPNAGSRRGAGGRRADSGRHGGLITTAPRGPAKPPGRPCCRSCSTSLPPVCPDRPKKAPGRGADRSAARSPGARGRGSRRGATGGR